MSESITLFEREMVHAHTMRSGDRCPSCGAHGAIELDQYQRGETRHHAAYCCKKCRATFGRVWAVS